MADAKGDSGKSDDYEFVAPDFDEHAFIHREIVSFRTTAILFVVGIVAAAVSWGLFVALKGAATGWWVGLLVCAVLGYSLKFLFPRFGADISHFKRREWTGTGFLFFFTWLSFFMLAINPPITDVAPPQVFLDAMPVQQAGTNLTVDMLATDNSHVTATTLRVERNGAEVQSTTQDLGNGHFSATVLAAAPGAYKVIATASDGRNADGHAVANVTVGNVLHLPAKRTLADAGDQVVVAIDGQHACTDQDVKDATACMHAVLFRHTDGSGDVLLEYKDDLKAWAASSAYAGWHAGANNVTLQAQFQDRFLGAQRVPGGVLALPDIITINVANPASGDGAHIVPVPAQPSHRQIQVPGPEVGLLAVAVLAVAAIAARRKAD